MPTLEEARAQRRALLQDETVDQQIDKIILDATRTMANPHAMKKLAPLIKYYAKFPHPFTKCVRDNRKRFGPLTEKYCAVIVDIIHGGNTHWRNGGKGRSINASDTVGSPPEITQEIIDIIDAMDEPEKARLEAIYQDALGVVHGN